MKNFYSKFIILILILIANFAVFSQSPEAFKYQAVVRDNSGQAIPNQDMGFKIVIYQNDCQSTGDIKYQEIFTVPTNNYGLVNLSIGLGTPILGQFDLIDWSQGPYYIETSVDISGGTNFVNMSCNELLSVPYALYAKNAGNSSDNQNLEDFILLPNNILSLSIEDGSSVSVDLNNLTGTDDQQIQAFDYDSINQTITLDLENGGTDSVKLSSYGFYGPTGPQGATGTNGISIHFQYKFETQTSFGGFVPNNYLQFNSWGTAINQLAISYYPNLMNGADIENYLKAQDDPNTNSYKSTMTIRSLDNIDHYFIFGIDTVFSTGTGHLVYDVSLISKTQNLLYFSQDENLAIDFNLSGGNSSGIHGVTGVQGIAGVTGAKGATGLQGVQGVDGSTGPQGINGLQGIAGVTGAKGATGLQGVQGVDGSTGPQGINGLQGIAGVTGAKGSTGLQGVQGVAGLTGPQGIIGPQGINGVTGPKGATGVQGLVGVTGNQGVTGPLVAGLFGETMYNNGSDWVSSSNLYNDDSFIGIGVTSPSNKLDVNGKIRMRGSSGYAGYVPVSDVNGVMTWTDPALIQTMDDQALVLNANLLTLENGGSPIDLSNYYDNTDNQNIQGSTFNSSSNELTIGIEGGGSQTISLGTLSNSGTDNQNIQGSSFNILTGQLIIGVENGSSQSLDLSSLDQNIGGSVFNSTTNLLTIGIEGGDSETIDLSFLNNSGTDNQNVQGSVFNSSSNELTIGIEGGTSQTLDLSALNNSGSDNQNIQGSSFNTLTGQLIIGVENGSSQSLDLSSLDQNIQGSSFNSSSNELTIGIEGGTSETIDLSLLSNSGTDNQNIQGSSFNSSSNELVIGIEGGTSQTISLNALNNDGTDDQNILGTVFNSSTNELTVGIENGNSQTVDLSSLKSGGNASVENYYYQVSNSVDSEPFVDNNIKIRWNETGNKLELIMLTPPSGNSNSMRSVAFLVGSGYPTDNTFINLTNYIYELYSYGVSAYERLEVFVTAEDDINYPAYKITVQNAGESYKNHIWIQKIYPY